MSIKKAVIERDGLWCLLALPGCNSEAQTTDHRAGRGSGGSRVLNHPGNLIAACFACNFAKERATGQLRLILIERGLRVERAATNAQTLARALATPVEGLDGRWWLLVDEHTRQEVRP